MKSDNTGLDVADLIDKGLIKSKDDLFNCIETIDESDMVKYNSVDGGFIALGYDGEYNVIWSIRRECVARISGMSDHMKLKSLIGSEWIKHEFPKVNLKGDIVGVDWEELSSKIAEDCSDAGVYSESKIRGAGVWLDDGQIILNADSLTKSSGESINRVGNYVYEKEPSFYNIHSVSGATDEECSLIYNSLDSFNFASTGDCKLLFGFISASFICGALDWRPHVCVTGRRGTGKSTLDGIIANLIGEYALHIEGDSTDAGIRQRLGHDARPVIIDEFGAEDDTRDSRTKAQKIIRLMRSASSDMGSGTLRGTADQSGTSFAVRFMCLISGTTPPSFTAADMSRIVTVELNNLDGNSAIPVVFRDRIKLSSIGKAMFKRMVTLYPDFIYNLNEFKSEIISGSTARAADTIGCLLAACSTMLYGRKLTKNEVKLEISSVDLREHYEDQNHLDEVDVLQHLLSTMITYDKDEETDDGIRRLRATSNILNILRNAVILGSESDMFILEQYGIKPEKELQLDGRCKLFVSAKRQHVMLNKIFSGTRWEMGGWTKQLKRLDGSEYTNKYIDGVRGKATSVLIDIECDGGKSRMSNIIEF